MSLHQLKSIQKLPIDLDTAWDFFSSPANLKVITPDYMGFEVTSEGSDAKMFPGMIISYIVRPILHFPMEWVTEITHVKDKEYFVDEQRFGPYSLWHHKHFFTSIEGGVEMTDIVHYKVPLGPLGDLANLLFIRRKLNEIFDYRTKVLNDLFGTL
jgi:ligand-binding SRPBCC domain-containing protein